MAQCPSCGTENSGEARFCRNCGKMMEATAPSPTPMAGDALSAPVTARSGTTNAILVIGLIVGLVALAAAAGYYFLAGPGSREAARASDVPPPPASQPLNAAVEPPQAPAAQSQDPVPSTVPPAEVVPSPPMAVPPPQIAPPQTQPPKPRRRAPDESAFFPEGSPPMNSMPPPGVMNDPNGGRWMRMRDEMYRCGYETYCQDKVRQRYCAGYWGRVPDCVRTSGYPPY